MNYILNYILNYMMPRSKNLTPCELAHRLVKGLRIRPDMSIKVGCQSHDMRILSRIAPCYARNNS